MRRMLVCSVLCLGTWSLAGGALAEGPTPSVVQTPATPPEAPVQNAPAVQPPTAAPPPSANPSTPQPPTDPALQPVAPVAPVAPAAAPETPAAPPPVAPPSAAAAAPPQQQIQSPAPSVAIERDSERLPVDAPPPEPHGPFVRLQLGVAVALVTTGSEYSKLRLPASAQLDLGYQFSEAIAVALRAGTWLSHDSFGITFLGLGVVHGFEPEGMFVAGFLGLSFVDPGFEISEEDRQGLAAHVDIGQRFTLAESLYFSVGGHFELGTPLGSSERARELVAFGVGPFVSLRWGS